MAHPMGESKEGVLRVDFDRRVKLEFHGSNVTSEAGLLPYRELDDAVELTEMAGDVLADGRTGKNGRHGMIGLCLVKTWSTRFITRLSCADADHVAPGNLWSGRPAGSKIANKAYPLEPRRSLFRRMRIKDPHHLISGRIRV